MTLRVYLRGYVRACVRACVFVECRRFTTCSRSAQLAQRSTSSSKDSTRTAAARLIWANSSARPCPRESHSCAYAWRRPAPAGPVRAISEPYPSHAARWSAGSQALAHGACGWSCGCRSAPDVYAYVASSSAPLLGRLAGTPYEPSTRPRNARRRSERSRRRASRPWSVS